MADFRSPNMEDLMYLNIALSFWMALGSVRAVRAALISVVVIVW